ncbi:unnamed protein product [Phyllotreta striolata]|uniref:Phospholipid scramblase n=1 Tax=Phyllotreta striolata TaxID=444603 RepID=A0A9N9THP9_PHYSR|nr:unnamed protein product [Phyllotreta striolata]
MNNDKLFNNMENIELHELPMQRNNTDGVEETAVTNQPRSDYPGSRRPIPVSLVEQDYRRTIAPASGLEFLRDVNQLIIQQSIELNDLISNISSENRYIVKVPRRDAIYYATETSGDFQRNCFGSGRAFVMRLFDRTQQEALILERRLACGNCTFWCYLQRMEVWIPPGDYVGVVRQQFSMAMKAVFYVYNDCELLYRIEGPSSFGCILGKAQNFQIYNYDGSTQIGSIIYQWDQVQVCYNMLLQMPSNIANNKHKALLLGSAFLLEYMFFESSKKRSRCCRCIC